MTAVGIIAIMMALTALRRWLLRRLMLNARLPIFPRSREAGERQQAMSSSDPVAGGLSPTEALMAHTDSVDASLLTAAASMIGGGGRISVGQPADFAVLSSDPMDIGLPEAAMRPAVLETYVGGKRMYTKHPEGAD